MNDLNPCTTMDDTNVEAAACSSARERSLNSIALIQGKVDDLLQTLGHLGGRIQVPMKALRSGLWDRNMFLLSSDLRYRCASVGEGLLKLLFALDQVFSGGDEAVRKARKALVQEIQAAIAASDGLTRQALEAVTAYKALQPQDSSSEAASSVASDGAESEHSGEAVDSADETHSVIDEDFSEVPISSDEEGEGDEMEEEPVALKETQEEAVSPTATLPPSNLRPIAWDEALDRQPCQCRSPWCVQSTRAAYSETEEAEEAERQAAAVATLRQLQRRRQLEQQRQLLWEQEQQRQRQLQERHRALQRQRQQSCFPRYGYRYGPSLFGDGGF